jgi:hypothetical protein
MKVGTWDWAQATDGRLRRRDRAELLRQAVLARLGGLVAARRSPPDGPGIELPDPPDSALARSAEECARELSTPELYAHCLRTWAFAEMFATRERTRHDPELLYVACLLHDLGLTAAHDRVDASAQCFAVEGARAARERICGWGGGEERALRVAEAITLHLNVTVPASMGVEAQLLSKGVSLDTVGRRLHRLPPSSVGRVDGQWPRGGFAEQLVAVTGHQAEVRPRSRSAFLHGLGFADLLRANPLAMGSH